MTRHHGHSLPLRQSPCDCGEEISKVPRKLMPDAVRGDQRRLYLDGISARLKSSDQIEDLSCLAFVGNDGLNFGAVRRWRHNRNYRKSADA